MLRPSFLRRLLRGVTVTVPARNAAAVFTNRRALRIKYGIDPTRPELHLGYLTVLRKLRLLQERGHTAVIVIGDFTARFGDPTEQLTARTLKSREEVNRTAEGYADQLFRVLDRGRTEIRRNSEWYEEMSAEELLRLMATTTVATVSEREMFRARQRQGSAVWLHELVYPLLQGYDSVMVRADCTIVGQDQLFNELIGRTLQERAGQKPQVILATALLPGTDGKRKMSQSFGNHIALTEAPEEQFGKLMTIPDSVVATYATLLTELPTDEIRRAIRAGSLRARDAKAKVAEAIVAELWGQERAERAAEAFARRFRDRVLPETLRTHAVEKGDVPLVELLVATGFAASRSAARRLVTQGGVSLGGRVIIDPNARVAIPQDRQGIVLSVGKWRQPVRIVRKGFS